MHIISRQSRSKCIKQGTYSLTHEQLNHTQLYSVNMREVYSFWNQTFMTCSEKCQKLSLSQIEGKVTSVRPFPNLRKEFNLIVGCFCVMRSTLLHLWGQGMDCTLGTRSLMYIVPFSCWTQTPNYSCVSALSGDIDQSVSARISSQGSRLEARATIVRFNCEYFLQSLSLDICSSCEYILAQKLNCPGI